MNLSKKKFFLGIVLFTFSSSTGCFGFPSEEAAQIEEQNNVCFLKIKLKNCTEAKLLEVAIGDTFLDPVFVGGAEYEDDFRCLPVPCLNEDGRDSEIQSISIIGNEIKTTPEEVNNVVFYDDEDTCYSVAARHHFEVQCDGEAFYRNKEDELMTVEEQLGYTQGWQNERKKELRVECSNKKGISAVKSEYVGKKDRRWKWVCSSRAKQNFDHEYWSGTVNDYDDPMFFMCKANYIMCGARSTHSSGKGDRLWKFKCCKANNHFTRNCALTDFVNSMKGKMNFSPGGKVITGAYSFHKNSKEDRQWKFNYCEYKKCQGI